MKNVKIKALFHRFTGCFGCNHTERLLFDYVEGTLDPERACKLRHHLGDCPECLKFVEAYRRTVALTHDCDPPNHVKMPSRLREKLEQFIATNPEFK